MLTKLKPNFPPTLLILSSFEKHAHSSEIELTTTLIILTLNTRPLTPSGPLRLVENETVDECSGHFWRIILHCSFSHLHTLLKIWILLFQWENMKKSEENAFNFHISSPTSTMCLHLHSYYYEPFSLLLRSNFPLLYKVLFHLVWSIAVAILTSLSCIINQFSTYTRPTCHLIMQYLRYLKIKDLTFSWCRTNLLTHDSKELSLLLLSPVLSSQFLFSLSHFNYAFAHIFVPIWPFQQNPQNTVSNQQMNVHFYIIPDQKVQSNLMLMFWTAPFSNIPISKDPKWYCSSLYNLI